MRQPESSQLATHRARPIENEPGVLHSGPANLVQSRIRRPPAEIGLAVEVVGSGGGVGMVAGGVAMIVPSATPVALGLIQAWPVAAFMPLTSAFKVCSCFGRPKCRTPGIRTLSAPER